MKHQFIYDRAIRTDYHKRRWCAICGLPETNKIHDLPEITGDVSDRILGEDEHSTGEQ